MVSGTLSRRSVVAAAQSQPRRTSVYPAPHYKHKIRTDLPTHSEKKIALVRAPSSVRDWASLNRSL